MKFHQIFLSIFFLFFTSISVFAEPKKLPFPPEHENEDIDDIKNFRDDRRNYKNFHGRRLADDEREFMPIFIKINEIYDGILFEVFFTQPIDAMSLKNDCIFINNFPFDSRNIRFSKNNREICFVLPKLEKEPDFNLKNFNLKIKNVASIRREIMEDMELSNLSPNSEYRFLEKEGIWKKS